MRLFGTSGVLVWYEIFLSLNIYNILEYLKRERDISYQKLRTDRQQTNAQMLEIKGTSYAYDGQLSTDKDDRKLGHLLIIPFPVWAGIEINFSPNRKRKEN